MALEGCDSSCTSISEFRGPPLNLVLWSQYSLYFLFYDYYLPLCCFVFGLGKNTIPLLRPNFVKQLKFVKSLRRTFEQVMEWYPLSLLSMLLLDLFDKERSSLSFKRILCNIKTGRYARNGIQNIIKLWFLRNKECQAYTILTKATQPSCQHVYSNRTKVLVPHPYFETGCDPSPLASWKRVGLDPS